MTEHRLTLYTDEALDIVGVEDGHIGMRLRLDMIPTDLSPTERLKRIEQCVLLPGEVRRRTERDKEREQRRPPGVS
jgi:hypothetical protein